MAERPSIYTRAREWAELGLVRDVFWFASFPDSRGERKRRGYLTLVGVNRDNRETFTRQIEECREFKSWFNHDVTKDSWSFDMHDIPDFELLTKVESDRG